MSLRFHFAKFLFLQDSYVYHFVIVSHRPRFLFFTANEFKIYFQSLALSLYKKFLSESRIVFLTLHRPIRFFYYLSFCSSIFRNLNVVNQRTMMLLRESYFGFFSEYKGKVRSVFFHYYDKPSIRTDLEKKKK